MFKDQGVNLILNFFFGPVVNAARGIANQVNGGLQSFVTNITVPVRPQVIQSYSQGNLDRSLTLTYTISKLSCYFLLLMALPIMLEIDFVLKIWLGSNIPEYTSIFVIIIILNSFISNLNAAVSGLVHASGKMKTYQLCGGTISLLSVVIVYIAILLWQVPSIALIVLLALDVIRQVVALIVIKFIVNEFSLRKYFKISTKNSSKIILDKTYLSNNIEIITNNSDIDFKYSNDDNVKIVVYAEKEDELNVSEETDKIVVNLKDDTKKFFGFNNIGNKIDVYIPKTYDKDIKINSNLGDIEAVALEKSNINIDIDCGDIDIASAKSTIIKSDLGDISIGKVSEYINIESDCGDIEIDNASLIKNSTIKSDLGDVEIDRIYGVYVKAKTDVGKVKIKDNDKYSETTLSITSDVGEVSIN